MCNENTLVKLIDDSHLEPFEKVELARLAKSQYQGSSAVILMSVKMANYIFLVSQKSEELTAEIVGIKTKCQSLCSGSAKVKVVCDTIISCKIEICVLLAIISITIIVRPELGVVISSLAKSMG